MTEPNLKRLCPECGWHGGDDEVLTGEPPCIENCDILLIGNFGCPSCKASSSIVTACDEPGCWDEVDIEMPVPSGELRCTCSAHLPKLDVYPILMSDEAMDRIRNSDEFKRILTEIGMPTTADPNYPIKP